MTRIDKFLSAFKSNEIFRKKTLSKLVNILGNMEKRMMDKNWLKTISIYSPKLKEGNTFRTSVWSHLQEKVSPALAQILTIDSNDNLDLMETKEAWRKLFT